MGFFGSAGMACSFLPRPASATLPAPPRVPRAPFARQAPRAAHLPVAQASYQGLTLGRGKLSSFGSKGGWAGDSKAVAADWYEARNRSVSALLGRWDRRDPLGYVDGPNLYGVCASNPVRLVDPTGHAAAVWESEPNDHFFQANPIATLAPGQVARGVGNLYVDVDQDYWSFDMIGESPELRISVGSQGYICPVRDGCKLSETWFAPLMDIYDQSGTLLLHVECLPFAGSCLHLSLPMPVGWRYRVAVSTDNWHGKPQEGAMYVLNLMNIGE